MMTFAGPTAPRAPLPVGSRPTRLPGGMSSRSSSARVGLSAAAPAAAVPLGVPAPPAAASRAVEGVRLLGRWALSMARPACRLLVAAQLLGGCTQPPVPPPPPPAPSLTVAPAPSEFPRPRPPLAGEAVTFLDTERAPDDADFAWSADGAELAVEEPGQLVGLWDARTGTRRASVPVPGAVLSLRFSDDGATLRVVTMRGAAAFRAGTGECLRFVPVESRREALRAVFGGSATGVVATVNIDGLVRALDVATGELRWQVEAGDLATFDPTVTAADRFVTQSGSGIAIRAFDTGAIVTTVRPPEAGWLAHLAPDARSAMFVAPDRRAFALADPDGGRVRLRQALRGNSAYVSGMIPEADRPRPGDGDPAEVNAVVFSADASIAAVTYDPPNSTYGLLGKDYAAVFVDVARGTTRRLAGTVGAAGTFGAGARRFYAQGDPMTEEVLAFDVATGKQKPAPLPRESLDSAAAVSPGDGEMASLAWNEVRVLDLASGAVRFSVPVAPNPGSLDHPMFPIMDAAIEGAADRVVFGGALGGHDERRGPAWGVLARWDPRGGRVQAQGLPRRPEALAWLPGGQGIASIEHGTEATYTHYLAARDATLHERWSALVYDEDFVASPDGRLLAFPLRDAVRVVAASTGKELANHPDQPINAAAFDPQGKLLAVRSYRKGVTVFGAESGAQIAAIAAPAGHVWFLPDGSLVVDEPGKLAFYDPHSGARTGDVTVPSENLVAVSRDGTVVLYAGGAVVETPTGEVRARLPPGGPPWTLNAHRSDRLLSPDGERVAFADEAAATIEIHDTRDGAVLRRLLTPPGAKLASFSADHAWLAILTLTGVELLRVQDGSTLELGLVAQPAGGPAAPPVGGLAAQPAAAGDDDVATFGHAIWLASGHFEADAIAGPHVRTWTATGPATGAEREPFVREGVTADYPWASAH